MANVKIIKAIEPWCEYHLEDGSILKTRLTIAPVVVRKEGQYDANGRPVYDFQAGQMVALEPAERLCLPPVPKAAAPAQDNARAAAEALVSGRPLADGLTQT